MRAFGALVDEFWFVDINYYVRRTPRVRGFRIEDLQTKELVIGKSKLAVKNNQFRHPHFNHNLNLNFVTGDGETAFDDLFCKPDSLHELSIFFHRGDSQGESGSNVYWLHDADADGNPKGHLKTVLDKLANPGLICTDGSNAIEALRSHFDDRDAPPDTHASLPPIKCHSCKLSPIATLDNRYGPTVVYQTTRP